MQNAKGKTRFFHRWGCFVTPCRCFAPFFIVFAPEQTPICTCMVSSLYASKGTKRLNVLIINDNAQNKIVFFGMIAGKEPMYCNFG